LKFHTLPRQSVERKITLGVGGGHVHGVNGVLFLIRRDDGRIGNGRITDIKNRARKLSGEVLPRKPQGGEWEQQAQGRSFDEQPRPSRYSATIQGWIEHGDESPFQIRWAGNRECGRPAAVSILERPSEIEHLIRIAGGFDSAVQDGIVAGPFTLCSQTRGGEPRERMEPVQTAGEFRATLQGPVTTCDVRKFMR